MNKENKSNNFFASAFAALVLLPIVLFVVFLLAVGYRFAWISAGQIPVFFAIAMLVVLGAFVILRSQAKKAFFTPPKK